MHATASLSWKPIAPEEKMCKMINKFNIYACMHAGASLSWKSVAPGVNMRKN